MTHEDPKEKAIEPIMGSRAPAITLAIVIVVWIVVVLAIYLSGHMVPLFIGIIPPIALVCFYSWTALLKR